MKIRTCCAAVAVVFATQAFAQEGGRIYQSHAVSRRAPPWSVPRRLARPGARRAHRIAGQFRSAHAAGGGRPGHPHRRNRGARCGAAERHEPARKRARSQDPGVERPAGGARRGGEDRRAGAQFSDQHEYRSGAREGPGAGHRSEEPSRWCSSRCARVAPMLMEPSSGLPCRSARSTSRSSRSSAIWRGSRAARATLARWRSAWRLRAPVPCGLPTRCRTPAGGPRTARRSTPPARASSSSAPPR